MTTLALYTVGLSEFLRTEISSKLITDHYDFHHLDYGAKTYDSLVKDKELIDCLIVFPSNKKQQLLVKSLLDKGILLPIIVIHSNNKTPDAEIKDCYHTATQYVDGTQLTHVSNIIDQAIAQFLHLAPSCLLSDKPKEIPESSDDSRQAFFLLQQRRLAEKLKERLGYLGVYYKRNPKYFYRNLSEQEKEEFKKQFLSDYREIVLDYFNGNPPTIQAIDQFVNQAFFADVSVSYILETHMKLMDEFAQQLKLEGRSEEILLDYRLTLIDIVAHLCEMYRRSIPREDLPFELLLRMD